MSSPDLIPVDDCTAFLMISEMSEILQHRMTFAGMGKDRASFLFVWDIERVRQGKHELAHQVMLELLNPGHPMCRLHLRSKGLAWKAHLALAGIAALRGATYEVADEFVLAPPQEDGAGPAGFNSEVVN